MIFHAVVTVDLDGGVTSSARNTFNEEMKKEKGRWMLLGEFSPGIAASRDAGFFATSAHFSRCA